MNGTMFRVFDGANVHYINYEAGLKIAFGSFHQSYSVWNEYEEVIDGGQGVSVLMQNIGISDSFNESIFEKDIIEIIYDTAWADEKSSRHIIEYKGDEGYPAYELSPSRDVEMNGLAWLKSECDPSVESYRVIGNIYENPELMA